MPSIFNEIARQISNKPQRTQVEPNPSISGGLGVIDGMNLDGTARVVYNGATFSAYVTSGNQYPAGSSVLMLVVGTQVWALGSPTQGELPSGAISMPGPPRSAEPLRPQVRKTQTAPPVQFPPLASDPPILVGSIYYNTTLGVLRKCGAQGWSNV